MKLLIDTHVFLWLMSAPNKLSATALAACEDPTNALYLSVASVWEIQIKSQLKKLALDLPLEELIRQQQAANDFLILPIELSHVLALNGLPLYH